MSEVYTLQLRQLPDTRMRVPLIVGLVIEDEVFTMLFRQLFSTYLTFLTNHIPGELSLANTNLPSTTPLAGISTSKTTMNRLFSSMRERGQSPSLMA